LQNVYLRLYSDFASFIRRARDRGIQKTLVRMADHEITEAYRFHFKVEKRDARREIAAAYGDTEEGGQVSPVDWVLATGTSEIQKIVRQEEYQRIMQLLRQLDPVEQYVTVSRIIEGISADAIGKKIGKSRGAVHMILSRARDKLRARAGQDPLGPGK
jgi:RNA polymerase sigma factor (sigma-70 family)